MNIIVDKTFGLSTPPSSHITYRGIERYQVLQGPRESCESKICAINYDSNERGPCAQFITTRNFAGLKPCMEKCFVDKKDEIARCCEQECAYTSSSTKGYDECMSACNTQLVYGGEEVVNKPKWMCDRTDGKCQCTEAETGGTYMSRGDCMGSCMNHPSCVQQQKQAQVSNMCTIL